MAKKRVGDAEFERQYETATALGKVRAQGPRAVAVFYDEEDDAVVLEFSTRGAVEIPRTLLGELAGAAPSDLAGVELSPQGTALHWEDLDVDISVAGAVALVVGPQIMMAAMGSAGGRVASDLKADAARLNGLKGGRPRAGTWAKASASVKAGTAARGRSTAPASKGGSRRGD
jgi:hypothetical protein